jgi:hypothetical protein
VRNTAKAALTIESRSSFVFSARRNFRGLDNVTPSSIAALNSQ